MNNTLQQVRTVLMTTPGRWKTLTKMLSTDLLASPAAPKEWSALECLQHLVDAERLVFPRRVESFLAGENFPAFDPDSQGEKPDPQRTPTDLAATFAQLREESLAALEKVTASDLDRQAQHAQLGQVTLGELLNEWAAHDLMHTVQAERALMQPFIRACGPWQAFFSDHIAK